MWKNPLYKKQDTIFFYRDLKRTDSNILVESFVLIVYVVLSLYNILLESVVLSEQVCFILERILIYMYVLFICFLYSLYDY